MGKKNWKKKQNRNIPLQGDWPINVSRYFNSNRSIGKRRCERIFIIIIWNPNKDRRFYEKFLPISPAGIDNEFHPPSHGLTIIYLHDRFTSRMKLARWVESIQNRRSMYRGTVIYLFAFTWMGIKFSLRTCIN